MMIVIWLTVTFYCATLCQCGICFLSVCPSVINRYCTKMAQDRITKITPYNSSRSFVFCC